MNRVTQYANDVIKGKILAGKSVRLACKRHLNDLDRQLNDDTFPYIFDEEKANEILEFAEILIIVEGFESKQLELAPFQAFIFGSLFAWIHKDTGFRRFRQSYVQVARQQGKSLMNGVLGIKFSNFDGYSHAQIGIAATKLSQSKIVFKEIIKMVEADSELAELFKIQEYKSEIQALNTKGTIKALSRDDKLDGFRNYLNILDEYHQHKTNEIYSALLYGQRMLKQCLTSIITTAGEDFNSPCFPFYEYCLQVLDDNSMNEQLFIYIAQMDEDDDIWNPDNWVKCMPLLETVPEMRESIEIDAKKAKVIGGKDLNDFMTKVFNIWCTNTDTQFVDVAKWRKCQSDLTLEDMRGKECYIGIDLSGGGKGDLSSLAFEFPLENNQFFIHSMSFMAKAHLDSHIQSDQAPYGKWVKDKLIELTDGYKTDFKRIIQYLKDIQDQYDLKYKMICYDAHNINMMLDELDGFGCDIVEIKQSAKSLNEATLDFKLTVDEGNILYNKNNELLTWSVINAKLDYNSFGECKIEKNSRTKRIDPVDAVIDAHKMAMLQKNHVNLNDYITDEKLKEMGW